MQLFPIRNVNVWHVLHVIFSLNRFRYSTIRTIVVLAQQNAVRTNYDIRFSQAIKLLFFGVVNATSGLGAENAMCNRSNYTSRQPVLTGGGTVISESLGQDPVDIQLLSFTRTLYGLLQWVQIISRLYAHGTLPLLFPILQGFHLYSYSLDFICLDPLGSTNYGKLTNISLRLTASARCLQLPHRRAFGGNTLQTHRSILSSLLHQQSTIISFVFRVVLLVSQCSKLIKKLRFLNILCI